MEGDRFREIVRFAILKEEEAAAAYKAASRIVTRSNVRDMLLSFATQEEGHKRRLEAVDLESVAAADIRAVPDLKIADYTDGVEITAAMDYQEILVVAMKREEKAHNLYTALASKAEDAGLSKLFTFLAQEEARHKLALEKEYDEHVLSDN